MGIVALKKAVERGAFSSGKWDLMFMGEDIAPADLGSGVIVRPCKWLDYSSYAGLLRECDIGLSLMLSPHTGYPALEMAACGASVVTTTYSVKTTERLKSFSGNIIPANPTVESITDAIIAAVGRTDQFEARRLGSIMNLPTSWDDVFEPVVPKVVEMIEECLNR